MQKQPAIYRYDLVTGENIWVSFGAEQFWGYSQDEIREMGDQIIVELIHPDDLHLVNLHHNALRECNVGQSHELLVRGWGKDDLHPRFVCFRDTCVALEPGTKKCGQIEGTITEVTNSEFDGRKLMERALRRGEFIFHYQPVRDLVTGDLHGFEALARWQRGGIAYPPVHFLPWLSGEKEQTWIRQQIAQVEDFLLDLPEHLKVGFNVSQSVLMSKTLPFLLEGFAFPTRLWLEVLESVSLRNSQIVSSLQEVKSYGYVLKADDVGSEFGGLDRFLKKGLFSAIKLDGMVTRNVLVDDHCTRVTQNLINMAHDLDLEVIAEWVETQPQADWLRDAGCQYGQGRLFGMPVPAEEALMHVENPVLPDAGMVG